MLLERILGTQKARGFTDFGGRIEEITPTEYEGGLTRFDVTVSNETVVRTIALFSYAGLDLKLPELLEKEVKLNSTVIKNGSAPVSLDHHLQYKGPDGEYDLRQQIAHDGNSSYVVNGNIRRVNGHDESRINYYFKIEDREVTVSEPVRAVRVSETALVGHS